MVFPQGKAQVLLDWTGGSLAGLHVHGEQQRAAQLQAAQLGGVVDVQRRQRGQRQRQAAHPG